MNKSHLLSEKIYVYLIFLSWIAFFVIQIIFKNEILITIVSIIFTLILLLNREKGELHLFALGFFMGLLIEVGLGTISRIQHWENASLFGVPYWLPIIWGYGFVAIRRIGNLVVHRINDL